jgi:hypothetical protein
LAIVLAVLLSFGHCFGCPVFWPLYWLSVFDLRLLITFGIFKLYLTPWKLKFLQYVYMIINSIIKLIDWLIHWCLMIPLAYSYYHQIIMI